MGVVMLLPRKDLGRNFPKSLPRHTSADDVGLLCAENTESFLVYSPFHLLCLGARDVLRRRGTRDRFALRWYFLIMAAICANVTHANFRNTPSLGKKLRGAPKLLNWKCLVGGFKGILELRNRSLQYSKPSLTQSPLYCDYCDTKFDYHLPLMMVKRIQKTGCCRCV
jgi:hypothetical protein